MRDLRLFEQLSKAMVDRLREFDVDEEDVQAVAEQLRVVWNARGAADLETIEAKLSSLMGLITAGPYVKNLDQALRKLDR